MVLPGVVASSRTAAAAGGAVRFSASTMKYSRTATGLNADMTWCCWVKLAVDLNTYTMILSSDNGASNYNTLGAGVSGTLVGRLMTGGDTTTSPGFDLTVGTWAFIGCVHGTAVTDFFVYMNAGGTLGQSNASDAASSGLADANTFYIGSSGVAGTSGVNGSVAAVKVWTTALTFTELNAERLTYAPVKTAGLWAAYKFNAGPQTVDDSGNGRTLTQGGTPVLDASGPPIT